MNRPITILAVSVAAVTATVVSATGSAVAAPADGAAGGSGCPAVAGIFLPGTWETNPSADPARPVGMLAPVATGLQARFGSRFLARFPGYSASAWDRGLSYADSEATGIAAATREITGIARRCAATKFVLSGYSQGADAIGDVAAGIGCHSDPIPPQRVIAVGLVADPKQGTAGGKLVGPRVTGQGIEGPRPSGFCQLSAITAELCDPRDEYCSTDAATNPILAGLGRILTGHTPGPAAGPSTGSGPSDSPGTTDGPDKTAALTQSLISDFTGADLPRLASNINTVVSQALSGHLDPAIVSSAATAVQSTLGPLADLARWAGGNPSATAGLTHAPAGSPQRQAGQVLTAAQNSNLSAALNSVAAIASGASGTNNAGPGDLTGAAKTLASSTAAMTSTPADALSQAQAVLSILKPSTMFDQVVNVATNTLAFATNVPKILDTLREIVGTVGDGHTDLAAKVRALHQQFGQLNVLCNPLVKMAAGVDLHLVANLLALIPDPQGIAQIASTVVGILANLDVVELALQVGGLQDQLWGIAGAITGGGNLLDVGSRFLGLTPTLLGFATTAVNTLTGAAKTPAAALDATPAGGSAPSMGGAPDLASLAGALTNSASQGLADLGKLVSAGISAASFFASGVHEGYDHFVVDGSGRSAITWLADWFASRIQQVGAV
ncbi:cutinase family protein [Nocardia terpenica]|uniref:Cutinase n=1 Tax=Nocardia terpenica TaxID=455432 RepID=A0A291RRL2_9NOCA|nr:cutinase family protein [Nocardia terpenica]ATL69888.1 cutinase [Nocardia terpenica]